MIFLRRLFYFFLNFYDYFNLHVYGLIFSQESFNYMHNSFSIKEHFYFYRHYFYRCSTKFNSYKFFSQNFVLRGGSCYILISRGPASASDLLYLAIHLWNWFISRNFTLWFTETYFSIPLIFDTLCLLLYSSLLCSSLNKDSLDYLAKARSPSITTSPAFSYSPSKHV